MATINIYGSSFKIYDIIQTEDTKSGLTEMTGNGRQNSIRDC